MTLDALNELSPEAFLDVMGGIYEHSPWVASAALPFRPFPNLPSLQQTLRETVDAAPLARQMTLIQAHPDLAGKLARAGNLTAESTREQAGLGLDQLSDQEYLLFSELNARYRERFGFPFIICARKHSRDSVLAAFRQRLKHDRDSEILEALRQIHDIAALRLGDAIHSGS
ncbi:2-oxo-4-hydroxy-4-carboxy-5-ureidoimidazoline decarboxylase [Haloferula luteola]|uniref:2-oxo-4-hydroxy-4-carboxy-5-ureidoimidazoline decarboxylase n=1 Tax=Haloferula luteola TaxID=595692 RepID=A0A840VFC9_9BACT|nr:2-oxo-4-hydroxy-4-carboxy-5-ureidoimidazoline decarboxylase [Haloferula luteola]MBB5351511.1 2-oxo-4-hydroxy-4-carboxy-5-ureidoimidazoline decarboxylase [Haloferula luteola]